VAPTVLGGVPGPVGCQKSITPLDQGVRGGPGRDTVPDRRPEAAAVLGSSSPTAIRLDRGFSTRAARTSALASPEGQATTTSIPKGSPRSVVTRVTCL